MSEELNDEHDWMAKDDPRMARWPAIREQMNFSMCRRCGVVKREDGLNKPCKGKMPEITLRS